MDHNLTRGKLNGLHRKVREGDINLSLGRLSFFGQLSFGGLTFGQLSQRHVELTRAQTRKILKENVKERWWSKAIFCF